MAEAETAGGPSLAAGITLSIIVPTYNNCGLTIDCLRSIEQNPPGEPFEIIVVDDCSKDETAKVIPALFPDVVFLRNEVNRRYAFSNNRAMEVAKGDFFLLLNNDTIVLPHALDRMIAFLRAHPDAGAVGCKLLNEDGSVQWSVKTLPNPGSALFGTRSLFARLWPSNPFTKKHIQHMDKDMKTPFIGGYVSSAAVMIPRHVAEAVGGLDTRLMYHVDADYSKRISDLGYNNWYLPTATIIHLDHRGGTMVNLKRRFRSKWEFHYGSYIYYQKHLQKSVLEPMHALVFIGLAGRFVVSILKQVVLELKRPFRRQPAAEPQREAQS